MVSVKGTTTILGRFIEVHRITVKSKYDRIGAAFRSTFSLISHFFYTRKWSVSDAQFSQVIQVPPTKEKINEQF